MNYIKIFIFNFFILNSSLSFAQELLNKNSKIYVAGHTGLVGSSIVQTLVQKGYTNLITRYSEECDLRNQVAVESFFASERPEYVFLAAAKVGGIKANMDSPAQFIYDNLLISSNVIHASYKYGVKKLLFLGSACIYPRSCLQPIKEEYLLTGELEKTNEYYAIAKICGLKLCQAYHKEYGCNFISCMPTNLYGPGDNFNLSTSHVLPALITKFYTAKKEGKKEVLIWGTGKPTREFLYVEDMADAAIFLMEHYNGYEAINVGIGEEISIMLLAQLIKEIIGFEGQIIFDISMPDGTPRRFLDISMLQELGWKAKTNLREGIKKTLDWCIKEKIFE